MLHKPDHLAPEYGQQFQDRSIVDAYHLRPPYPSEVFDILAGLVQGEFRHILDVGTGCGNIARNLVERVEQVDAVDFSRHMIEKGKTLPNGDNPRLRWIFGRAEDAPLNPPYGLVTAGESLHWMDWNIVLPRFHDVLVSGGYLAVITHETTFDLWFDVLREIIPRYSTNKKYQPFDMIEAFEQHGLFQKVGERTTIPVPFTQSVDDYIESYHSRNGFSRERMEPSQAAAFDREAREILLKSHPDGRMSLEVVATIVWGLPGSAKEK